MESGMRLKGKTILIAGANGQLGKEFTRACIREGAFVWMGDLDPESLERTIGELGGQNVAGVQLDVTVPESWDLALEKISSMSKGVDVLINNAALQVFKSFEDRPFTEFMRSLEVNVGGVFLGIQKVSARMRDRGTGGNVVNLGSIYGVVSGDPRIYTDCARKTSEVYGASKAAVIQMTRYFAVHLAEHGIRVNCLSPGGVANNQGEDFVRNYSYRTPMGRMAESREIADALIFLASDDSKYVNGHNLLVDGGWTSW